MGYLKIDIELCNFFYHPNESVTLENHVVNFIQHELNKKTEQVHTLILCMWIEEYNYRGLQTIQESINVIKEKFSLNVVLLLGEQYRRIRYTFEKPQIMEFKNADVNYIWGFPYRFYTKVFDHKISEPSDTYQKQEVNKFLLLMGKPNRIHRVGLLYKLYKKDLLKHCLWRFKIHNEYLYDACKKLLRFHFPDMDISDEEFDTFVQKCQRDLDNIEMIYHPDSSHYSGIPFERWIWDTTAFQVVPEVDFRDNFPSEKTWLSIMNKTPFIMLAQIYHNAELRKLGFRTFEKYLLHKDYNDVECPNVEFRLDQIIENIEYWLENIDKHYEEIKIDVEHNFDTFVKLVTRDEEIINSIISKYNLNCKAEDIVVGYYP